MVELFEYHLILRVALSPTPTNSQFLGSWISRFLPCATCRATSYHKALITSPVFSLPKRDTSCKSITRFNHHSKSHNHAAQQQRILHHHLLEQAYIRRWWALVVTLYHDQQTLAANPFNKYLADDWSNITYPDGEWVTEAMRMRMERFRFQFRARMYRHQIKRQTSKLTFL